MTGNEGNTVCPLLKNPDQYSPDTVDLGANAHERKYWLPCIEQMVKKFVNNAKYLRPDDPKATEKAELCYQKFHNLIEQLTLDPTSLKPLSVRTLLEFHEDNLRANNLKDAFELQKERENNLAMKQFKNRISQIDSINDFDQKWFEIAKGVLAGNVFDWGAKAVTDILESTENFGLFEALDIIEKRPWFCDKLDLWINKLKERPYQCCVIFLDNSGVDLVLGMLPLARELLSQGTKVILTANSHPSLNDVTIRDLNLCCCEASEHCSIIKEAITNEKLVTVENGQKGPCLDFLNVSPDLCKLMDSVDLIIIEGMGRAVHTNLYAKFTVDCVKLAVLKNEWLAKSLGAQQFSVICDFENTTSH